jgi:hypothetical protein
MPGWVQSNHEVLSHMVPFPRTPYNGTFIGTWGPILVSYLKGDISRPEEALIQGKEAFIEAVEIEKGG